MAGLAGNLPAGEEVGELGRQVAGDDAVAGAVAGDLDAEQIGQGGSDEGLDGLHVADGLVDGAEVLGDVLGLDRILGEDAARGGLAGGGFVDLAGDVGLGGGGLAEIGEIEEHLLVRAAAARDAAVGVEQQGLRDGVDDALGVFGEGHVDAGGALDLADLAQEHVEDDAVDGVVRAVDEAGLDFGGLLAEAVDAALALFEAVGVPRQVVVQHAGEEVLQVDAFAEAVGGDEHARLVARHFGDVLFAEVVGVLAGDHTQVELGELFAQDGFEEFAEVVGGLDVAAEDHGLEAFGEPLFEDDGCSVEFLVVADVTELGELFGEMAQLTALVVGPVALFDNLGGGVVALEAEVEVADGVV